MAATETPSLESVFAKFDGLVRATLFGAPAPAAALKRAETKLGKLPPSLRALYEWHDGEAPEGRLFHSLCRDDISALWLSEAAFDIRLLKLAEVTAMGPTTAYFAGEEASIKPIAGATEATLIPFLWIRDGGDGTRDEASLEVSDDDWLISVGTHDDAVYLFEVGGEGLEGVFEQAPSLAVWLGRLVGRLERAKAAKDKAAAAKAPVVIKPDSPALMLLRILVDKEQVALAEGVKLEDVAARIAPFLAIPRPKLAAKAMLEFFEEDDMIDEVFADQDVLQMIVKEFLD